MDTKQMERAGESERQSGQPAAQHRSNTSFHNVRYMIIVLCGLAMGSMLFTRLTVTVAMLSMVNHTHLYLAEHPNSTVEDFFEPDYVEVGIFDWSNEVQQTIIAGYMLAYTLPQVFTTRISLKYGIRSSISVCLLICSLSCLLTPIVAYWGWQWMLALRLLNGFGASAILPSVISAIEVWMPDSDSALGLSLVQFTQGLVYIATPLISGELASIHWEWAFYVPGLVGLIFVLLWVLLVRNSPESCSYISKLEIDIIKGTRTTRRNSDRELQQVKKPRRTDVPWYFMFKFVSFYFFIISWILYCCTFGGLLFLLPSYFHKILKISVEKNGFYNFIIQLGTMFSMLWSQPVIAFLQAKFDMSLTNARRIVVLVYSTMTVVTLLYLAAYHENQIVIIFINRFFQMTNDTIITATLMTQFGREGLSGLAYSMMNTFGNLVSVVFCWASGRFLDYTGESRACWSWIFTAMALLNVALIFIYTFFLKSEPIELKTNESEKEGKEPKV